MAMDLCLIHTETILTVSYLNYNTQGLRQAWSLMPSKNKCLECLGIVFNMMSNKHHVDLINWEISQHMWEFAKGTENWSPESIMLHSNKTCTCCKQSWKAEIKCCLAALSPQAPLQNAVCRQGFRQHVEQWWLHPPSKEEKQTWHKQC